MTNEILEKIKKRNRAILNLESPVLNPQGVTLKPGVDIILSVTIRPQKKTRVKATLFVLTKGKEPGQDVAIKLNKGETVEECLEAFAKDMLPAELVFKASLGTSVMEAAAGSRIPALEFLLAHALSSKGNSIVEIAPGGLIAVFKIKLGSGEDGPVLEGWIKQKKLTPFLLSEN